ncbi:MAG: polysaccharide deacetylase family protein [Anaerolineales bacterium]|nr:polysaccharide deacetylase family protein [Anaerolineales bacterium]
MKKISAFVLGISILLSACSAGNFATPSPTLTLTLTPLPPTETATVTNTATITPTFTPAPTATPTWVVQGPGHVVVPILLYHWIEASKNDGPNYTSPYYVKPELFEAEMKLLHDWGYQTISIEMLLDAIQNGAELPPRPMLITLDDGHADNYTNAFPIMQKYGFTGTLYLVGNYVGADGYMNVEQAKEMLNAGWEVGSHTMNHLDLSALDPERQRYEIVESKKVLEEKLGAPVKTIAYPFGLTGGAISYVHFAGYIAGMGLGFTHDQGAGNIYTLQRRDVKGTYDVKQFASFLPWQGDPTFLPTDTPAPTATPSRTPRPTQTP